MELHRLDGLALEGYGGSGLDNVDIVDIDSEILMEGYNPSQVEALEALGYVKEPEIAYEILDEHGNVVMYADAEENLYTVDGLGELGFLKKIGKGLKNATKFVGKKVIKPVAKGVSNAARFTGKKILKPVITTVNRYANPATILLRNGFLLAMKINLLKVAEKLRFGYLPNSEAKRRGVNMGEFAKLKKVVEKAEKIYTVAGGKKENLKKAILSGKGNRDNAVALAGFELGDFGYADYADDFERFVVESDPFLVEAQVFGLDGLGDPATGAAVTAATGAVASIAALLTKITGVFDKAKQTADSARGVITALKPQDDSQETPMEAEGEEELPPDLQKLLAEGAKGSAALRSDGAKTDNPDEQETWLQKNKTPLMVGAGVLLAAGGIMYAMKGSGGGSRRKATRAKSLNGISRKKRRKATSGSKKKRLPRKLTPLAIL